MRSHFEFVNRGQDSAYFDYDKEAPEAAHPMEGKTWGCSCCVGYEILETKADKVGAIKAIIESCESKLQEYRTLLEQVEAIPDTEHISHFSDDEDDY